MGQARSEWIAFHDSDDICVFDRIERQVRVLLTLPPDHVGVYSAWIVYAETTEARFRDGRAFIRPDPRNKRSLSGDGCKETVSNNFINLPTMLIRKAAFVAAGGFDERLRNNHDWDFTLRLTRLGKFGFLPEPLYLAVRHEPKAGTGWHVSVNARYSARSFVAVLFKLRRAGVADRLLVGHYLSAARFLMRTGRFASARRYLGRALQTSPVSPTGWRLYVLSHLPRLYAWLRRNDNRPV